MTDLNEWNLSYTPKYGGPVDYDFGHSSNDSPFTTQVDVGSPDRTNYDYQHGTDNAVLMGRDLLGGMDITFNITTVRDESGDGVAINAADKIAEFLGKWRADGISRTPGASATLTNKWRNRFVLGRPRDCQPKYDRLRKGNVGLVAVFHTISPDFYRTTQRLLHPGEDVDMFTDILGDVPAWPIITFTGKFSTASLQWTPPLGFGTGWTITINHAIATSIPVVIDTRPWMRLARDNLGKMQNGWLAGSKMGDCFLVPSVSTGHFLFTTTGATDGNTKCDVAWYDAYAGL